jgi:hypothetical protein
MIELHMVFRLVPELRQIFAEARDRGQRDTNPRWCRLDAWKGIRARLATLVGPARIGKLLSVTGNELLSSVETMDAVFAHIRSAMPACQGNCKCKRGAAAAWPPGSRRSPGRR